MNLTMDSVEGSELVEQTFAFWFTNNEHIRSPFPNYIQHEVKALATDRFFQWVAGLNDKAKDELNDEMVGEKFEEIIFEEATKLVKTEDERITILYPFLPRLEDPISDADGKPGAIVDRNFRKEGDTSFLDITVKRNDGSTWLTSFELPV